MNLNSKINLLSDINKQSDIFMNNNFDILYPPKNISMYNTQLVDLNKSTLVSKKIDNYFTDLLNVKDPVKKLNIKTESFFSKFYDDYIEDANTLYINRKYAHLIN